ncbi:hypothetical protein MMPV_005388 [Pyropia vietnamensis]
MAERPEKRQRVGEGANDGAVSGVVAAADAAAAVAANAASAVVGAVPQQPLKPPVLTAAAPVGVAPSGTDAPEGGASVAPGGAAGTSAAAKAVGGGRAQDVGAFLGRGSGRLEFDPNAPSMAAPTAGAQGAVAPGAAAGPAPTDRVVYSSGSWEVAEAITRKMPKHAVPFTLLTGFLGAGKSTVLNYILRQPHGLRIAVLINELGEIDIDNQLVTATDVGEEDDVMELNNGCICCTISNSFIDAVQRILARFKDAPPDYLIVETTGVADPEPIMNAVQATELAEELYWDQVLTVVDASQFDDAHYGSETARKQVNSADTVLLSKTDLMEPEAVDAAVQRIIRMKPSARILRSQRGHVPVAALFDLGMSLRRGTPETTPAATNGASSAAGAVAKATPTTNGSSAAGSTGAHAHGPDCKEDDKCDHDHGPGGHHHGHGHNHGGGAAAAVPNHLEREGFTSVSFSANKPFKLSTFRDKFVDTLPSGVFRSKGLLWFRHYPSRFLLQVSGKRFQMDQDMWPEGTAPSNQLVVIGRDFDRNAIVRSLEECLVEPVADSDDDMTSDDEMGMLGDDPGMPPDRQGGYGQLGEDEDYPYEGEDGDEDQGVGGAANGRGGGYGSPGKAADTGVV